MAWSEGESKLEPHEEQRPSVLARVESFSGSQELDVLMISEYDEGVEGTLQPVTLFLQC